MKYLITKYIAFIGLMMLVSSCAAEMPWGDGVTDGLPVEFNCLIDDGGTRNLSGVRSFFSKNDVIHVQGVFYYDDDESKEDRKSTTLYGALKFDGTNRWLPVDGSKLIWPNTAKSGKFKAYHVNGSTGVITGGETQTYYLTNMTPATDPLGAPMTEELPYGHAVDLIFRHLPTYISFFEMPRVTSNYFFFLKTDADGVPDQEMKNAFKLVKNDKNELNLEWVTAPDMGYYKAGTDEMGLVYVRGYIYTLNNREQTNFMLAPGNYDNFSIRYVTSKPNTVEYMRYSFTPGTFKDQNGNNVEMDALDLESGRSYTMNIAKTQGVTVVAPPEDNHGWDDNGQVYDIVVEDFLRAVANSKDYFVDDKVTGSRVQILKKDGTGVRLLHNVDFKNEYYTTFGADNFVSEIRGTDQLFNGDYHYIHNVGCTIFQNNQGRIKNLGIQDARMARMVTEELNGSNDFKHKGLLVGQNLETGNIENIRIKGTVKIDVGVNPASNMSTGEAHDVGGVVGYNIGKIDGVKFMDGWLTLDVANYENMQFNSTVSIGGIVGQNAGNGSVTDVSVVSQPFGLNITNSCKGNNGNMDAGAFYVGGFAGQSSATIDNISISDIKIDGSKSIGVVSYMGGMVGNIISSTSAGRLTSCTASGSVRAGVSKPYAAVDSESCIGGIAGTIQNVTVTDCRAAFSVYGYMTPNSDVTYCTGGAFGRIRLSPTVSGITAYGDALKGLMSGGKSCGVGNFTGVVPAGQSWDTYKNNDITVRQFDGYNNIGVSL